MAEILRQTQRQIVEVKHGHYCSSVNNQIIKKWNIGKNERLTVSTRHHSNLNPR